VISHSSLMTDHTHPMRSLTSRIAPAKPLACAGLRFRSVVRSAHRRRSRKIASDIFAS
jgi:hypothetical protein